MLQFLPAPLIGVIMLSLLICNTVFWAVPVYICIFVKLLLPRGPVRDWVSRIAAWLAQTWAVFNSMLVNVLLAVKWDIRIDAELDPKGQYLVCANHQSWNDIVVVMRAFGRRAPFFKFFIKQELIWVPILGPVWWGLDFPFMKRHTKEQIARNPALKGKDLETTRKACENFRNQPAMILNFLEGTRFTQAKHARQQSPYKHLLKPKSGGFAFTMGAMGEKLNSLLDVTIVYPGGAQGFWALLSGRVRHVIVEVRKLTIPHALYVGDYENDREFRAQFQTWIAQLWAEKDQRIESILAEAGSATQSR